jgi:SAM-dependent methyltransferase
MNLSPTDPWDDLLDAASEPYRRSGTFAWRFARGKLGFDPVFRHVLANGLIPPNARVLDLGCGQGLLASLMRACSMYAQQGRWPGNWAAAPARVRVTGIEMMESDIERARASLGDAGEFVCGDMRTTPFPQVDTVVILDVLHYITVPEQNEVLARVRDSLSSHGRLLLRVGDKASRRGFLTSQWVDAIVTRVRGHRVTPTFGRTLAEWKTQLESLGFEVRSEQPMSKLPFANVLLVADVKGTT